MPTWGEIQEYARSKYTLSNDDAESFSLIFEFEDKRTQQIGVHRFTAYDKEWIEFRTYVCKEADMNPKVALRKNCDMPIGALALDDEGDYCLVYSAPLATMDPDEFELPLKVMSVVADNLEEQHSAGDAY